ncbi:MAG: SpoIID/LytB domain-containing protein [Bacteroidales bacterium]|nr:SpoIID/LytB domain-containing protein [Bacteroidales bacterium]
MKFLASIVIVLNYIVIFSQSVKVRILSGNEIRNIQMTIYSGTYELIDEKGNVLTTLNRDQTVSISLNNNEIQCITQQDTFKTTKSFSFRGKGFINIFQLRSARIDRLYDDHLQVLLQGKSIWLINEVSLDKYVASVVQAEAGVGKEAEFFKAHAIATRTYSLKNFQKHKTENFNFCDQEHCQVYKGRCTRTDILVAAMQTHDLVLVDNNNELALTVYHSNSGGETAAAEHIWGKFVPYLLQKKDSFSVGQSQYNWTKKINKQEWLLYLKKNYSYPIEDPVKVKEVLSFRQPSRKIYLAEQIPLKQIRIDWKLNSTFFDIYEEEDHVVFKGKGFGHGVGFSQEGAMQMARLGFTYDEILEFYYPNTTITRLDKIGFKFNP